MGVTHLESTARARSRGARAVLAGCLLIVQGWCLQACSHSSSPTAPSPVELARETSHFTIRYQAADASCIDAVAEVLEGNYQRICADLRSWPDFKVVVTLYPDLVSFHQAIGSPNAPDWVVGLANLSGEFKIVSPLHPGPQHTYQSIMLALVHEFAHAVILRGIGATRLPQWLQEGVPFYEAGQMDAGGWAAIQSYVETNRIPTFADLSDQSKFADIGGYFWSSTMVDFAVVTYGRDTIRPWIDNNGSFDSTFGITEDAFRSRWIDYLKAHYGGAGEAR